MQKNLKNLLSLLLALVMVLGMIPFTAFAGETQVVSDLPTSIDGLSIAYPYNTETVQLTGTPADRFDALTFESARGEVESAQLILTPNFAVDSFELTMSSLKNENGNIIPSWAFEVFAQHYVMVSGSGNAANYSSKYSMYNPTYSTTGYDGTFPDALLPMETAIAYGENKIAAGNNQGIWVNLDVQDAAPGTYTGYATLNINGTDMQIPVSVKVYDVKLPEQVHTKSSVGIWYDQLEAGEGYIDRKLADTYFEYVVSKRIMPLDAWSLTRWDDAFSEYAATYLAVSPEIASYALHIEKNADHTVNTDALKTTLTTLINKNIELVQAGQDVDLFKKAYFSWIYDEPRNDSQYALCNTITAQLDAVKAELAPLLADYPNLQESFMNLKQLVTAPNPTDKTYAKVGTIFNYFINDNYGNTVLTGDSYIYCPQYQWLNSQTQRAMYENEEELWWYGCCHPIDPFPTYHINTPLVSARLEGWMRYAYGIDGFVYSSVNHWGDYTDDGIALYDYWNGYKNNGTPGDQILVLPGSDYGIYGPIGTIRIENIREANEDYEYLWMLENQFGGSISTYTAGLYEGTIPNQDASAHYAKRIALLEDLEEMNIAANGATQIAPGQEGFVRGEQFLEATNLVIDPDVTEPAELLSFEYKITGGDYFHIGLLSDWSNMYGYFKFNANGAAETYDGVTTETLDDGYIRVTFDVAALTKISGAPTAVIDLLYVRGNWSNATGYIDKVTFAEKPEPEYRGTAFEAGASQYLTVEENEYMSLSFDYIITDDGTLGLGAQTDSSNTYGYFYFTKDGERDDYAGVTTEKLEDGYVRATLMLSEITKISGTPTDRLTQLHISGSRTTGNGYIDNITGVEKQETVIRGVEFKASTSQDVKVEKNAYESLSLEYLITDDGYLGFGIQDENGNIYGYFTFYASGEKEDYAGVTVEKLPDGYNRVTFTLSEITKFGSETTPNNVLKNIRISGSRTTANGYIDNVQGVLVPEEPEPPTVFEGAAFTQDGKTILLDKTQEVNYMSFDYKIETGTKFNIAFMTDWSNMFGYFAFGPTGANSTYDGIVTEALADGYVRVYVDMNALTKVSGAPTKFLDFMYIRSYDWTDASGEITNIRINQSAYIAPRGDKFTAGVNMTPMISATTDVETLYFDYQITGGEYFHIGLMPDWQNFYGYYKFNATGAAENYDGVTTETLDDGYIRVTFDVAALTKINGTPTKIIDFLYLRGSWSQADGYIDNIGYTAHTHSYDAVVTDPTCTAEGFTTHTCACGHSYTDTQVAALGHNYESVVTEPTPDAQGYTTHTCTNCGDSYVDSYTDYLPTAGYMELSADMNVEMNLTGDLYVNLNGFDMTGKIVTNGYAVYGMDATTDSYTCENIGYFSCVDAEGNAIVPESTYKTEDAKRYLTIETETGYTFHRIYVGITKRSLAPAVTGVGYKAEFYGDEMVQAQVTGIGYNLWLEGGKTVSRSAAFKNLLTLRVNNFDAVNYGETNLYATVWMTIGDETITSSEYALTLRQLVETVNADVSAYSETQLEAVRSMIAANPVMESWQIENIVKQEVIRGELVDTTAGKTIVLNNTEILETISFEYKMVDGTKFNIALMPDWSNSFGYFAFAADGARENYDGVTSEVLEDGYIRVTFDLNAITKMNGTPSKVIDFLYIRSYDWSDAQCYIDNVSYTVFKPTLNFAGAAYAPNTGAVIELKDGKVNDLAVTRLTFDYTVESGEYFHAALMPDWSSYYGYYKFDANGVVGSYPGVVTKKLEDGSVRAYIDLSKAATVGNPSNVITMLYVRGDWTNASGTVSNICINDAAEYAPRGELVDTSAGKTIVLDNTQNLSTLSFDYKMIEGTKFNIALMPDWSNYFGYFAFGSEGARENYAGITTEVLEDGYIRVTFDLTALTKVNNTPSTVLALLYIRSYDWSDSICYIDNIQFS